MIKVTIERPDVKGTITLTMHDVGEDGNAVDLKDTMRFLTEVARAAGFSYVEDTAALTNKDVVAGAEFLYIWEKRIKGPEKKKGKN